MNVASGDLINVELSSLSGVMHLVRRNTVTAATISTDLTVGNLPAVLGPDTAYLGFTAATGGTVSQT